MGRFADIVSSLNPVNGVMTDREGRPFDRAADGLFRQRYDIQFQSLNNGSARLSGVRREVNQEVFWIGVNLPPNRLLFLFSDEVKVSEGDFTLEVFRAPDGFTGGTAGVKSCLCETGVQNIEAELFFDVTPTNTETQQLIQQTFVDPGVQPGARRVGAAPFEDRVFQMFKTPYLIKLTRDSGGAFTVGYQVVLWEEATE